MSQQELLLLALVAVCVVGLVATVLMLRNRREAAKESPIAASSEGVKLCPHCATENLVTDSTCSTCGRKLPEAPLRGW